MQQKMPGGEHEKNQRTRHQLQKSKGQHGPDRHQGVGQWKWSGSTSTYGTTIDSKLGWSSNIGACCKKENQLLYFLRKLKQFQVDKKILVRVYQTIIQSVMFYNQVCYFSNSKKADTERLDKVARTGAKIAGAETATPSTSTEVLL